MEPDISDFETGEDHSDLPPPIIFNCWKHHLGFIRKQIRKYSVMGIYNPNAVTPYLLLIGNSQTDLYIGELQEEEISNEILTQLKRSDLYFEEEYVKWIDFSPKNFRLLKLSDDSIWTLRRGIQPQRYLHIHPGRHTLNSIRIRANTLKTAILVIILSKTEGVSPLDLSLINSARVKSLGLAPVKSIERSNGLVELINLINSD